MLEHLNVSVGKRKRVINWHAIQKYVTIICIYYHFVTYTERIQRYVWRRGTIKLFEEPLLNFCVLTQRLLYLDLDYSPLCILPLFVVANTNSQHIPKLVQYIQIWIRALHSNRSFVYETSSFIGKIFKSLTSISWAIDHSVNNTERV